MVLQVLLGHVDINAYANHHELDSLLVRFHLRQDPRHFTLLDEDVVGPLDAAGSPRLTQGIYQCDSCQKR
jgi:hypothetical protein